MPRISSIRQTADCSLSKVDTYADAMLRTLYSFKTPSPPIPLHARRQNHRSYPQSTTVSQSVVNENAEGEIIFKQKKKSTKVSLGIMWSK
ncbi:unnamed protein product [Rotaria magnacalcarata]|uniref:Uncharacterized protein n=1 Tax=Rotaria magnacalcarata TaxID=392030 RepID=A0A8S2SEY5_9BILA|nr:unnamed protein product [Rotaria magnacalcarata]